MSGTFDPTHTGAGIALSNGNLTALATSTASTIGTAGLVVDATQDVSFVYTHDNVTNSFRYGIALASISPTALPPDMSTTAGAATAIQCSQGGNCNNSAGTRLATPSTSRPAVGSQTEIRLKNGKLYFRYRASTGAAWPTTYNGASGLYQNADPALDNGIPLTPNFPSGSVVYPMFAGDNAGVTMDATNWTAGGATYSASVAESGSAADAASSAGVFGSAQTEAGAAADTSSSRATFGSSVGEAGSASSTQAAFNTYAASVTEAGAATNTVSSKATFNSSRAESGAAADQVSGALQVRPSPDRTASVVAEVRTAAVDAEVRRVAVDAEVRIAAVPIESRLVAVDAESRIAPVAAESRVIIVQETDVAIQTFNKDPDAILDYTLDWNAFLGTDTISTATWVLDPGLTKVSQSNTPTAATIFVSGGVDQTTYNVTCRIVTAGGRTDDRSITLKVANK